MVARTPTHGGATNTELKKKQKGGFETLRDDETEKDLSNISSYSVKLLINYSNECLKSKQCTEMQ